VQHRGSYEDVNIKGGARSSAFLMGCSGIELRRDFWPITSRRHRISDRAMFRVAADCSAFGSTAPLHRLLRLRMLRPPPYSGHRIGSQKIPIVNQDVFLL